MRDKVTSTKAQDRFTRKLESIGDLSDDERELIHSLPVSTRIVPADQDIFREGDHPSNCCLVIEGFVHRYKMLQDGKRQIVSLHIPGDIPDLQGLHLRTMDHSLGALALSEVASIPHAAVLDAIEKRPRLGALFWRETLIDGSIFREWIANLGARSASQRIAHLLCELYMRLEAVDLAIDTGFNLPLTQAEIGDATGLSTVHVNRTFQELRANQLIASQGRFLQILDWPGLQSVGGFDPSYLHLRERKDL